MKIENWLNSIFFNLQSLFFNHSLWEADCFVGADVCASATLGANFRVDGIDVALGDCSSRTFVDTGTASDAVFTNYISHSLLFYN